MRQWNTGLRLKGAAMSREERTSSGIFKKTTKLEVMKQTVGTSISPRKMSDWRLWRGQPPPKRKKRPLTTA
jgi:hypothetical protein